MLPVTPTRARNGAFSSDSTLWLISSLAAAISCVVMSGGKWAVSTILRAVRNMSFVPWVQIYVPGAICFRKFCVKPSCITFQTALIYPEATKDQVHLKFFGFFSHTSCTPTHIVELSTI